MKPIFLVIFTIIYSLFYFISSYYIRNLSFNTNNTLFEIFISISYLFLYIKIKKAIENKISDQTIQG